MSEDYYKLYGRQYGVQRWTPSDTIPDWACSGEVWASVIIQAIEDATSHWPAGSPNWSEAVNNIIRAREWLLEDKDYFPYVCHLAGISASALRKRIRKLRDDRWLRSSIFGEDKDGQ
jgi:hypothetical protein